MRHTHTKKKKGVASARPKKRGRGLRAASSPLSLVPTPKGSRTPGKIVRAITETILIFAMLFFVLSLLGVRAAWGRDVGMRSPFPASRVFPRPSGILFPGPDSAAGINPAALPSPDRVTAFQAAYTPPLKAGDPSEYFGALGVENRNVGFGIGYDGYKQGGSNTITNGVFAGLGFLFNPLSLGFGVRDLNLNSGGASLDLGLKAGGQERGMTFGAVLYQVNSSAAQVDVGLGYNGGKKYNLEINALLPPFKGGGGYAFTGSAMIFASSLGFYLRSTYFTQPSSFSHTVGLSLALSEKVNIALQYTTDRTLTTALTLFL